MHRLIACFVFGLLAGVGLNAYTEKLESLEVKVLWWYPDFELKGKSSRTFIPGTRLDFRKDLDFDRKHLLFYPEIKWRHNDWVYFGSWMRFSENARSKMTKAAVYNGLEFASGQDVFSKLKFSLGDIGTGRRMIRDDLLSMDFIGGVRLIDWDADLAAASVGAGGSFSEAVAFLGLAAQLPIMSGMRFDSELKFAPSDLANAHFVDAQFGFDWTLLGWIKLKAAYRLLNLGLDRDRFDGDLVMKGLVFSLGGRF